MGKSPQMAKGIWKRPELGGRDAVCVGSESTWKKDHTGLISFESEIPRNGNSTCTDVVRIRRQGSGTDGEEY